MDPLIVKKSPCIVRNPQVHVCVYNALSVLVPVLSETISVHTLPTYIFQVHFNTILLPVCLLSYL